MGREKILKEVQIAIREQLTDGSYDPGLPAETESLTGIGMDSYDVVCVGMKLEEKFNIVINDEKLSMMETVKDFVDTVETSL